LGDPFPIHVFFCGRPHTVHHQTYIWVTYPFPKPFQAKNSTVRL